MHRRHLLGDVFGDLDASSDGSTGAVLRESMRLIEREGRGAIVYLRTAGGATSGQDAATDLEGRLQTLRTGALSADEPALTARDGESAMPMAQREFGIGVQVLRALGLSKLRLITNHAREMPGLDAFGLEIVERVPASRR
jgi:3,4-dihydroxy 2-butanone 4-phosphate synthase/GTP cyclohydrolase II